MFAEGYIEPVQYRVQPLFTSESDGAVPIPLKIFIRRILNSVTLAVLFSYGALLVTGCGQTYRPVAIPVPQPGGDPEPIHYAVVVSQDTVNSPAGSIAQIDVSGDTNLGNKQVGVDPVHAVLQASLARGWIVNRGDSTVSTYSPLASGAPATTIALEPNAGAAYVDTGGSFAFVTETNLNKLAILDANQQVARAFVPVGSSPVAIAARPDGLKAYVANSGDDTVSVVSTQDNAVLGLPIPVGAGPQAVAMQSNGSFAYVASEAGGSLSVIDTSTDTEIQRVTGLGGPNKVVWDNNLKRVYVVNATANSISIFNAGAAQLTLLRTVNTSASPLGLAVLDNGSKFYVLYAGSPGTVDVFDAQSFTLRTTVTVQNNPVSIAAAPGSSKVYVVNKAGDPATAALANGSISVIKTLDESVLNIAPAAPNPVFVTVQ